MVLGKVQGINEVGRRAEEVLDNEKDKRSTYLSVFISLVSC